MKITKQEALAKIEELKQYIAEEENEWVKIDYSVIPREVFEKYGAKPFEIMRKKMRKDGKVWNNITFQDAKKEAEKIGHLPTIQEHLVLLDWNIHVKGNNVSIYDKEFLGIEELSYQEEVYFEWVDGPVVFLRGGSWCNASNDGVFTLNLNWHTDSTYNTVGFRCAR